MNISFHQKLDCIVFEIDMFSPIIRDPSTRRSWHSLICPVALIDGYSMSLALPGVQGLLDSESKRRNEKERLKNWKLLFVIKPH